MADELEFITVKAAKEDGRVALFEQHKANITDTNILGEVYVVGDGKAVKVARTPTVEQKLREGVLVEVAEAAPRWTSPPQMTDAEKKAAKAKAEAEARAQADAEARARITGQKS